MLDPMMMIQAAGRTFSLLFGSMGVFVLIVSFQAPSLFTAALLLLAMATITMLITRDKDESGPKRKNGKRRAAITRIWKQ